MKDLGKINSNQVYGLWKNLSVCMLAVVGVLVISKVLPYYLSPVVALLVASGLYVYIYNERFTKRRTCSVPPIAILYSIVDYAFLTIILNLMHVWGLFQMPHEFIFFTDPFIPTLILNPVSFVVLLIVYLNRRKLKPCIECRTRWNPGGLRGPGGILNSEAHIQLQNFIWMSGILSLATWAYYQFGYINTNINGRDDYIFTWLTVIGIGLDWLYFSWRYYNLYLDLKENNEILTPEELRNMSSKTYVRFYVICGNNMYLTEHAVEANSGRREVMDTPFFTELNINGLYQNDVKRMISDLTGINNGYLKFFFGRRSPEDNKHSLLRYFYFIDENMKSCPELETEGKWVSFDKVKYLYSNMPNSMAEFAVYDITRLATIMLTEKIFNEDGFRKSGIKSYRPSFNLMEVRNSNIDFQDDKWIQISLFNSDTPFYKLKKWWRDRTQSSTKKIG